MEERWHRFYWYLFHVLFIDNGHEPFAVQASAVLSNFFTQIIFGLTMQCVPFRFAGSC